MGRMVMYYPPSVKLHCARLGNAFALLVTQLFKFQRQLGFKRPLHANNRLVCNQYMGVRMPCICPFVPIGSFLRDV